MSISDEIANRRISKAARPETAGMSSFLDDGHLMAGIFRGIDDPDADEWAELSAIMVRRMANQHDCPGGECTSPNHRRDVDYARGMLEIFGLPCTVPFLTPAEYPKFRWEKDDALRST